MKITLEHDDGKVEVFQNVCDLYVALRQEIIKANPEEMRPALAYETRSFSAGSNPRELIKEVRQSLDELQDYLREQRSRASS